MVTVVQAPVLPGPAGPVGPVSRRPPRWRKPDWKLVAGVLAVAVGVGLRLTTTSPLWLDEALTVNIARLPVGQLLHALRADGSPPLFYLLLHAWIAAFGSGAVAVRALATVFSLAELPLLWTLARRVDRRLAGPALLLAATSPFAIRYATEARMYSLLALEATTLALVLQRGRRRPDAWLTGGVAVLATLLAYTHYWSLFALTPLGALALWRWRRGGEPAARTFGARVLLGLLGAGVLFLPQLPTFLFQARHTGTPWAAAANPTDLYATLQGWSGSGTWGVLLLLLTIAFAAIGYAARPMSAGGHGLSLRGTPTGRILAAGVLVPLVIAELAAAVGHSGFTFRYTSIVWPAWPLLVGWGLVVWGPGRGARISLALAAVAGLIAGGLQAYAPRSEAHAVAGRLAALAHPGDVIGYCPDQLGPSVSRLLPPTLGVRQFAFPDPFGPTRIDWIDYADRVQGSDPVGFAAALSAAAGPTHAVWLVSAPNYKPFGDACGVMAEALQQARGLPVVQIGGSSRYYEQQTLLLFDGHPRR